MAVGSHPPAHGVEEAPGFAEKKAAGVILRREIRPESSEDISGPSSQPFGRGSAEVATADFYFPDHRYRESFAAGQEQVALQDGLGAMRGFVLVLGVYLVMGVMGLAGLMLWHWLR